jgi:hypothetical protein
MTTQTVQYHNQYVTDRLNECESVNRPLHSKFKIVVLCNVSQFIAIADKVLLSLLNLRVACFFQITVLHISDFLTVLHGCLSASSYQHLLQHCTTVILVRTVYALCCVILAAGKFIKTVISCLMLSAAVATISVICQTI